MLAVIESLQWSVKGFKLQDLTELLLMNDLWNHPEKIWQKMQRCVKNRLKSAVLYYIENQGAEQLLRDTFFV